MAIDIKFDLTNNPEPPTIVLATRNGNKLGLLGVNVDSIDLSDNLVEASEFTFTLNKYVDEKLTPLWDKVVDFKLVYCKEWDMWFEIKVELDETTETVKTVFCTQLGQSELSQIKLYNIHINEEGDINWDSENQTYKSTILYDPQNTDSSLLHRLLKDKAPHYSIEYVDPTIARIQRSFSFDDTSICDAFNTIGEEIGCLFVYNSNSDAKGMPNRTISVYDLQQNCNGCGYRGEFTDKCPKCNSTDVTYGYGEDTTIFVTADELATEGIQLVTDTDSVKNCFKLEGGDDLMTATIRNCNPNGSDYIWYFSDAVKEDMSEELVNKIESYDALYKDYYNNHISTLDVNLVNKYNALVAKYKNYYDAPSACLNCGNEGNFESQCPICGSENILEGKRLQTISTPVIGYSALMNAYYNTVDLAWYLKSGLMPSIEMSDTNAKEQVMLLNSSNLSPVAVDTKNIDNTSRATANSAVLSMAKIIVRSTYKVEIENPDTTSWIDNGNGTKTWMGKFIVTNYSDEEDTAVSKQLISVIVNGDEETFIKQKIEKALIKEDTDDYSISGLFEKDYVDFCNELKKYALTPLTAFQDACETCRSILISQKVGNDTGSDLYNNLYVPYSNKLEAIRAEMKIREDEINTISGVYNGEGELDIVGLQTNIEECKKQIQEDLNFDTYLGEDLWLEFCLYRREDKYSNDNYVSDGLNNADLFKRALEFIEVAENEIFKSAELQHSISATLNNLLAIPKFKDLVKFFKVGNWIRVRINDEIYKLRLLKYDISYGDFNNISVKFSDVTKVKNGTTDIQSVLSQASSMASSYDSVQKQAKKGDVAQGTIEEWLADGLNSANVQIQNNNNEEILITKNGLFGRSKSDITGEYSPEQFRLTHNIMAYTTDDWKTVSTALGKHNYKYWEDDNFIDAEDYGLSTKFVTAGHIIGSQVIGGEIVSSNYKRGESGTYFNLIDGDFEIAGGNIAYKIKDGETGASTLKLKNVTIEWASTNQPDIKDVSGLEDALEDVEIDITKAKNESMDYTDKQGEDLKLYVNVQDVKLSEALTSAYEGYTNSEIKKLDDAVSNYLGWDGRTIIDDKHVISPYIAGGYLNITGTANGLRVLVDPNNLTGNGYAFQVHNGNYLNSDGSVGRIVMGVDSNGNAVFNGTVYAANGTFTGTVSGSTINGGEVISSNYQSGKSGTYFNLNNGNFEIAGGSIVYNGDSVSLKGVTIEWESTEAPPISKIEGLEEHLNQLDGRIQTYSQTSDPSLDWLTDEDKRAHSGDLWSNPNDGLTKRWNGISWDTVTDSELVELAQTKAQIFTSQPVPPYYVGDLWAQGATGDILHCIIPKLEGESYVESDWEISSKYTDDTVAKEALKEAAKGISLAQSAETNAKNYVDTQIGNFDSYVAKYLGLNGNTIIGENYVISPIIEGGYLNITNTNNQSRVIIDPNNLTKNGYIFQVHNGSKVAVGIDSSGNATFSGTITGSNIVGGSMLIGNSTTGYSAWISDTDGVFHAQGAVIDGEIHVSNGGTVGDFSITDALISGNKKTYNDGNQGIYVGTDGISCGSNFSVDKDGVVSINSGFLIAGNWTLRGEGLILMDRLSQQYLFELKQGSMTTKRNWNSEVSLFWNLEDYYVTFGSQTNNITFGEATYGNKAVLNGTWLTQSSIGVSSGLESIDYVSSISSDARYETLFDNLFVALYEHNYDVVGKKHIGYIGEFVSSAMNSAGLTANEFSGYIVDGSNVPYLRYDEFVALNTYQIQKLKSRVAALEAKINGV